VRREALLAERDWSVARNADTIAAYGEYLEKHPDGLWVGRAKARVTALSATPVAPVVAAPPDPEPAAQPATPPPATTSAPKPAPPPQVLVQLGAFSSADGAQKAWRELQSRHVALRTLQPVYRRSGKGATGLHLLKAGVATRADAEKLCRTLQAAGQACLIS
jgi:cell division septation protein DedD